MIRNYELIYIIPGKIEEKNIKEITDKIDKIIQEIKIKIVNKEDWGKRKLAYPIKQNQYGYYFLKYLETEPEKIKELNQKLKTIAEIIRYQIVKTKGIKPKEKEEENKKKEKVEKVKKEKVSLEELDKKIEEILKD